MLFLLIHDRQHEFENCTNWIKNRKHLRKKDPKSEFDTKSVLKSNKIKILRKFGDGPKPTPIASEIVSRPGESAVVLSSAVTLTRCSDESIRSVTAFYYGRLRVRDVNASSERSRENANVWRVLENFFGECERVEFYRRLSREGRSSLIFSKHFRSPHV